MSKGGRGDRLTWEEEGRSVVQPSLGSVGMSYFFRDHPNLERAALGL